jgi:hypothetical protein
MLRAIEDGDGEQLPAPVLIKGFLRAYAERVGLDPEAVIIEYQDLIEKVGSHQEAVENFHQRLHPKSSKIKFSALFVALALLTGLTFLWYRSNYVQRQPKTPVEGKSTTSVKVSQETIGDQASTGLEEEQYSDTTPQAVDQSKTELERESSELGGGEVTVDSPLTPFVVRIEALETTWLRVIIDESREREYLLQPGEQLSWMARSNLELLVGNAGGVMLYLNDQPLKPLGARGKVVRLELPDPLWLLDTISNRPSQGTDNDHGSQ